MLFVPVNYIGLEGAGNTTGQGQETHEGNIVAEKQSGDDCVVRFELINTKLRNHPNSHLFLRHI